MYGYIKGKITEIESNYVIIDNSNIGYIVYTPNPYSYSLNDEVTIYLYQYIREDENTLYGFKTKEEKEMFLKLIGVKGLGPKMALPILAASTPKGIIDAIERENILYLKKFPKIGDKVARQIILDLKGKLASQTKENTQDFTELIDALKSLGYKQSDINKVLKNIDKEETIENQIKEALKLMLKENG